MADFFPYLLIRRPGLAFSYLQALSADWSASETAFRQAVSDSSQAVIHLQSALDQVLYALPLSVQRTSLYNIRKQFFNRKTLRPGELEQLKQYEELETSLNNWIKSSKTLQEAEANLFALYEQRMESDYCVLQKAASETALQYGLMYSSRDLLLSLPQWRAKTPAEFSKKDKQYALSVAKYVTRAAAKTSPLSRFTTVGIYWPDREKSEWELPEWTGEKSVATPNVGLLPAFYEVLLQEPNFYRSLSVALNPCICAVQPEGYTWLFFNGETEAFQHSEPDAVVDALVEFLLKHNGRQSFSALVDYLEKQVAAERDELEAYLLGLIDPGLLEWIWPEKGLSAGWAGGLYQYLGSLPAQPLPTEAAALLQWLRGAARVLPHQSIEEGLQIQEETRRQLSNFFSRYALEIPEIPTEQLFFEDTEHTATSELPKETLQELLQAVRTAWHSAPPRKPQGERAFWLSCAFEQLKDGESRPFLSFCQNALQNKTAALPTDLPALPLPTDCRIGVLFQPYRNEEGHWKAVLNALFPGGGKLFARWLHLFPAAATESLLEWYPAGAAAYPWQGFHNAAFQPAASRTLVQVPSGRISARAGAAVVRLGEVFISRTGWDVYLHDRTGRRLQFIDLGLEAVTARPPVQQALWYLGQPYVSLSALVEAEAELLRPGLWHRAAQTHGPLVTARETWWIEPVFRSAWPLNSSASDYFKLRAVFEETGLPNRFFAHIGNRKPQYFDLDSPVLAALFVKSLRTGETDRVRITELLPGGAEEYCGEMQVL